MRNMQLAPDMLDARTVLAALRAFRKGDFSVRLPLDLFGLDGEIAQTFNEIVDLNEAISRSTPGFAIRSAPTARSGSGSAFRGPRAGGAIASRRSTR